MKRIICKLRNKKANNKKEKIIGITAVASKLGTTHIALSLANYISSFLRERVIYIEFADDCSLLSLVGENPVSIGDIDGYKFKGVEYVLTSDKCEVTELMASENAWIIIDISEYNDESAFIFNQSKKKILIGGFMPWNQRDYHEFIRKNIYKKIDFSTINFYQKNNSIEGKKLFMKQYGTRLETLPIIDNPFSLQENSFDELRKMIM